jgi:RHS repeat-associated protein
MLNCERSAKAVSTIHIQARYYDPVIGGFYSNDPIGFRDIHSFNRYTYANNNPYKYTDPNGESATLAACAAGPLG